ncbi:MAG: metallophosphoesterase family protein [Candidatus Diapherotrites archaeon]
MQLSLMSQRILRIENGRRAVFVGDTHGDIEASKAVISKFLDKDTKIIFLGDYVDRGEFSKENIDYLLETRERNPDNVFLLMGNHEAYEIAPFSPDDFWVSLSGSERAYYSSKLLSLPLAAVTKNKVIALHGALPILKKIEDFEKIELGSKEWKAITWGDYEFENESKEIKLCSGRPKYSKEEFEKAMKSLKMKLLIRAHQPTAPLIGYDGRCLTIFTSNYYAVSRRVAIVDLKKEIRDAKDVKILEI